MCWLSETVRWLSDPSSLNDFPVKFILQQTPRPKDPQWYFIRALPIGNTQLRWQRCRGPWTLVLWSNQIYHVFLRCLQEFPGLWLSFRWCHWSFEKDHISRRALQTVSIPPKCFPKTVFHTQLAHKGKELNSREAIVSNLKNTKVAKKEVWGSRSCCSRPT